jgi:superoxide reductase
MVKEKYEVWKCNICGNIIEVLYVGGGPLVCCGEDMELMVEKTEDEGKEKHVPVVEVDDDEIKVKVGEVSHPMEEAHYIQWIEVITDIENYVRYLKPQDAPEAEFKVEGKVQKVRAYCNVHGLWKKNV